MKEETGSNLLAELRFPEDIKNISDDDAIGLAVEIRNFLVEKVSKTGGHLASNLGVVELTIALYNVFDFPKDHLIFDVGHQSYVHKILSGRMDRFDELRKPGGLSGFTKISESEYDCFGAGHSSTSLSAALGFCMADKLKNSDAYTIAVIGDGAYTGGMIHEALNNCKKDDRLIIILNENEMSISKNIGAFANYIAKIRSSKGYYKFKGGTVRIIKRLPLIGNFLFKAVKWIKQIFKNKMYNSNYFEDMGLYYLGPVDGNDYKDVKNVLAEAKRAEQSVVVHIKTVKGKGFEAAERCPDEFHGIKPECEGKAAKKPGYSEMFGRIMKDIAGEHPDVCAVTAAMAAGTGLTGFAEEFPDRFFDVGIAEEHALTFCSGMAADGMKPFFAVYSSFLQRGYDNIIHDIALQRLPVTVCIGRTGLNSSDGPTHHGIFDVSFLSQIPNIQIFTPCSYESLRLAIYSAYNSGIPSFIRYPSGCESDVISSRFNHTGECVLLKKDYDAVDVIDTVIITYGSICEQAIIASDNLKEEGIRCGIILLEKLKPYDDTVKAIKEALPAGGCRILFLEEGIKNGGASMIIKEELEESGYSKASVICAIDDDFIYGDKDTPYIKSAGIDAETVALTIRNMLER